MNLFCSTTVSPHVVGSVSVCLVQSAVTLRRSTPLAWVVSVMALPRILAASTLRCYTIRQSHKLLALSTCRQFLSTSNHEPEYDIVIVGGGIVGMATARELALKHPHLKLSVVEKEDKLAFHQSGHNSGVIHAGIYYKPGSLKARLCVEGLQLAYEYLDKEGIPYKKCGKLIVAVNDKEVGRLLDLYDRAIHNGVPDVELIEGNEIKKYEPYCQGVKAIWSPHTGIVDWGLVTEHYGKNFRDCGGSIYLDFKVTDFQLTEDSKTGTTAAEYPVKVISNGRAVRCKYVLTCGGLQSDKLAKLSGCSEDPRIVPFRGEYLLLKKDKAHMVRGNIYPVATLRKYIPDISASDISRGPAGVRAQAMNVDGSLEDDFVFHRESGSALGSRILHCRNAPSPGATSSLSIAKMIADKCRTEFSL
ncbi:L-2-hydroxyglutarate dehydrogenase-like [Homarus americanus]|uniref:L-2-hydroxyglutarate dehydrogenase, mitochondrial n=1 Tax=Homarus americanus TaxID=6706 RepID=A0A8J5MRD9_HOMAM|nr:L-2-hydroxyglutarate dehydrogenase-like [Homarus americanus]